MLITQDLCTCTIIPVKQHINISYLKAHLLDVSQIFALLHTNDWSLKVRDEKKVFLFDQMGNGGGGTGVGIVGKEEEGKGGREGWVGVEVGTSEVNRRGGKAKRGTD